MYKRQNQNLQKARTQEEIISVTAKQLLKIFQRDIIAYRVTREELQQAEIFLVDDTMSPECYTSLKEREVAQWVLTNNKRAGAGTQTLSDARCTYLSIRTGQQIYGVVGIAASDKPLDSFEGGILDVYKRQKWPCGIAGDVIRGMTGGTRWRSFRRSVAS